MKQIKTALILTLLLILLLTGCGSMDYNYDAVPTATPTATAAATVLPVVTPDIEDGIVNDGDGIIGNEAPAESTVTAR